MTLDRAKPKTPTTNAQAVVTLLVVVTKQLEDVTLHIHNPVMSNNSTAASASNSLSLPTRTSGSSLQH